MNTTKITDMVVVAQQEFYQQQQYIYQQTLETVLADIEEIKAKHNCVEHINSRIKKPQSVLKKLQKHGVEPTLQNAKAELNDIVGIRVVCKFISDIYVVAQILQTRHNVKKIKDYIKQPKPNGYRSYHIIIEVQTNGEIIPVEVQLRTISQDSWASLEHQIKYKKNIKNESLVRAELKRCSDEMAATDICMQSIKEFIEDS